MSNTILIKRKTTSGAPSAGSLSTGELCLVVPDKQVYVKNNDGTVTLLNAGASAEVIANRQTASYTIVLTDAGAMKLLEMNVASANNVTVPPNSTTAFPIGSLVNVSQYGAGVTTIVAGAGVTINSSIGSLVLDARYAIVTLIKIGTDEWYLVGGIDSPLPAGSNKQVQYNNAGSYGGASNVEIDGNNLKLVSTTDPAAPAGGIILYSKLIAGKHLPKIIGPSGIDTVLQSGLHGNSVFMVAPASGTTAPSAWGGTLTTAATMSVQQTIASANPWLATWRKRFATSTTAGNASGMRTAYTQWFRGNVTGFGGFFFRAQLGMNINLNGGQKFVGLCASTGALAGEPSALLNMCGMGYDAADASTGNWFFMRNDGTGAATKVDLGTGAARNTTHGFDLIMFIAPNGSDLFVRITNLHTGTVVLDTSYNTDLPAVNTGMAFKAEVRNGAVAAADNLEVAKVYIESDY